MHARSLVPTRLSALRRTALAALAAVLLAALATVATPPSAVSAAPDAPSGLPDRVVGGYWTYWGSPRLGEVPVEFNTVYLFSARPVGGQPGSTGAVFFEQFVQSEASLVADIAALRGAGRAVILSVGGAGEYLDIGTRAREDAFVASIVSIYERLGGFDGLDWNIESADLPVANMVSASQRLKQRFGDGFAITTPPAPWRAAEMTFVSALRDAGVLDLVTPQYYDLTGLATEAERRAHAVANIGQWVTAAGGADKVGFGFRNVGAASETMTVDSAVQVWEEAVARHPGLRGAMVWSIELDRGIDYRFAHNMTTATGATLAGGPSPVAPGTFRDVFGETHLDAIERMAAAGIVRGYPDGSFRPFGQVTRGQMAAFVVRARELDTDGCSFEGGVGSDALGSTHRAAICAVLDAGIADGYEDGTYRAEVVISRAQMATLLARAFALPVAAGPSGFADTAGSRHEGSIAALVSAGITTGVTARTYEPDAPVRREQMATFLDRVLHR